MRRSRLPRPAVQLPPLVQRAVPQNKRARGGGGEALEAEAQIAAFEDTWHWTAHASDTFDEVAGRGDDVGRLLGAFVEALGHNDVTAYLTMMAPRLVELRRVMKPSASIYLHCDPTASHYLKTLMDAVFDARNFRNEIVWRRTSAHSDTGQGARHFGRISDTILFYSRTRQAAWNTQYGPYSEEYVERFYRHVEPETGRRFQLGDLTAAKPGGDTRYEWTAPDGRKVLPYRNRYWAYSRENMERFEREGRLHYPRSGIPRYKRYLDEMPGVPLQNIWTDIPPIGGSKEYLGYRTQKPEALLERIVEASSNPGDLVLDPFCGCGTATVAAHRLGRRWIGIDVTWLAVDLMRNRLRTTFPSDFPDDEPDSPRVDGEPADEAAALALAERDKYQFQFWAVARLGGTPRGGAERRGPDRGIDGAAAFPDRDPGDPDCPTLSHRQVVISVKGGATGVRDVRDLRGVVEREGAAIGVLVTASTRTREMEREAAAAGVWRSAWTGAAYPRIQLLTAGEIVRGARIAMPSRLSLPQYQPAPRAGERTEQGELI